RGDRRRKRVAGTRNMRSPRVIRWGNHTSPGGKGGPQFRHSIANGAADGTEMLGVAEQGTRQKLCVTHPWQYVTMFRSIECHQIGPRRPFPALPSVLPAQPA